MVKKIIHRYKDILYYRMLESSLRGCSTVLDVGCGSSSPLMYVNKTFKSEGVDIFVPSISKSKKKKIHDKYTKGNILELDKMYKNKSFDAVIALDVVEHFPKKQAHQLIRNMEKIAKKKVIIMTPNGFVPQTDYENNQFQVHQSGWYVKDFKRRHYSVWGLRGLKYIRGEFASIKYRPWFLWGLIATFTELLLFKTPTLSYHLFAVRDVDS